MMLCSIKWLLDLMVIGLDGYWTFGLLDLMDIGLDGYWTCWLLDLMVI